MKAAHVGRLIPILAVPLAAMTLAAPAGAASAQRATASTRHASPATGSAAAGYLWTSSTLGGPVNAFYAFNSAGGPGSVTKTATGQYTVTFPRLGSIATRSVVQVTPYSAAVTCTIGSWGSQSVNLIATVLCFSLSGHAPADAEFDVLVSHPLTTPHGIYDYAYVYKNSGQLTSTYQYDSAHRNISVANPRTGQYVVTFGGPRSSGVQGTVKVSPYGLTAGDCQPVGWHGSATGEVVDVDCRNAAGAFANRQFTVTFAAANNLLGLNGKTTANALEGSGAALIEPSVQYDSGRGARVTIIHTDTGMYEVALVGSRGNRSNGGDVQVSAVGDTGRHCISNGWSVGLTPIANVECYDASGHLADARLAVDWVVA
jgi:hypothetical protein